MDIKYSVFLGSTFEDLKEERWEAMKAILKLKHIPLGMEFFPGTGEDQFEYIKKVIDDSDYYIILLGGKYGSIRQGGDLSYTEMEYDYAKQTGKSIIGVVHRNPDELEVSKRETGPDKITKFHAFRSKVLNGLVEYWHDAKDIRLALIGSLSIIINEKPVTGWVRGDKSLNSKYDTLLHNYTSVLEENKKIKAISALGGNLPDTSQFASLKDNHTITISYFVNPDYVDDPNAKKDLTKRLSDFFIIIGRLCLRETPSIADLKEGFQYQLQTDYNVQLENSEEGSLDDDSMIINLSVTYDEFEKLLSHFELLELIDTYGGSGTVFLTEKGKNYYLSNTAIRK